MRGRWRDALAWMAACACALGAAGCGDSESEEVAPGIATTTPELDFAPEIALAPDEPHRPVGSRWLLDRSVLFFAEERGCADRKIAVGRRLGAQRSGPIDWLFVTGLGTRGRNYWRNPHDARCELRDVEVFADELTRPHDPGLRVEGLTPGEGFYLDLEDWARRGQPRGAPVPAYYERQDEGDSLERLTYWLLFPMSGRAARGAAHEGDWERVDVLLERHEEGRFTPQAVRLHSGRGTRDLAWSELSLSEGRHPVLAAARASHALSPVDGDCGRCERWTTWSELADVRAQPWYGFGGAWGEPGARSATTGPLGPHPLGWRAADEPD
jgi:hypothetical protein